MKKHLILTALASVSMLLTGCTTIGNNGNNTESISSSEQTAEGESWTILIYMCGSDLESGAEYDDYGNFQGTNTAKAGFASQDIAEILKVNDQPSNVNIVIETGGARAWANKKISANKLGRWHVENKDIVKDEEITYKSMGDSKTLSDFLTWGLEKYPADKTGVILWNHGGAMQGVCQDETTTGDFDMLTNSEVKTALQTTFTASGLSSDDRLEFIGYDACLMQVQDVAEFNSHYFNYMVGSEESEAGDGWEYNTWVSDLYAKKSTEQILGKIADRFVKAYDSLYPGYANDQTQSVLDLRKMASYKEAWEDLAKSIGSSISSYGKSNFHTFLKTKVKYFSSATYTYAELQELAQEYSDYYGETITVNELIKYFEMEKIDGLYWDFSTANRFAVFDVKDFLNKIIANDSFSAVKSKAQTALAALDELVIKNVVGDEAGESYGLSFFFPVSSSAGKSTYYKTSETNFTSWRSVVNNYGA